jgi:NitT/TauT family transport system substrate-binding protein
MAEQHVSCDQTLDDELGLDGYPVLRSLARTCLGLILGALAIGWVGNTAVAQPKKNIVITAYQAAPITEFAIVTSIPMYLKYYEAEGLNVSFEGSQGGVDAIQRMVSGSAQLAYNGTYPVVLARSKGVPIKAFLRTTKTSAGYPAVLQNSPIQDVKQFKGKVIGVNSMGTGQIPVIKAMLSEAGLDPEKDVRFVVAGVGAQALAAIRTGQVDVLGLWDAGYWEIEALGDQRFRKISSPLVDSLSWSVGMFALEDYMKKNPDVLIGVGRAVSKASVFAKANPEASIKIHWKVFPQTKPTGIDEATALKRQSEILKRRMETLDVDAANMKEWGKTDDKDARALYEFLQKSKALGKDYDPRDLFTNEFVGRINTYDARAIEASARAFKID